MTIAKDFVAKASVAVVAVAMILSLFAPAAKAQTTEELQKMINDLMAQIAALESGSSTTSSASVCPYTWTRDLKTGATGADVKVLQQFLNANADTRVAATGAGSVGMETETFGPATAAAVSKFQVMYRADILTPAGLVNPTGYFGPSTRAKANALCVTSTTSDDEDDEATDDEDADDEDVELSGEGTLDTLEVDDAADNDIEEGDEDVEIGEITIEAADGDIEITRMDFELSDDGSNSDDAWDVFETISLWVDGEMIADFDASDEDEYLDEDQGTFRMTGFSLVAMEDEEIEVTIAATVAGSVDNLDEDWTIDVTDARYFDADGVASDDSFTTNNDATVTVKIAGDGEALKFSLGSNSPSESNIIVDENDTTDGITVLEYTIEAEESDIELNDLSVNFITSGTYADIVDDLVLVVDGQTFKDDTTTTAAGSTTVSFDIDGDVVIDADTEITVEVIVDFKAEDGNYSGETFQASVTSRERDLTDAEGAEDITDLSGTAIGDEHTLIEAGVVDASLEVDQDGGGDSGIGTFTFEIELQAVEDDAFIATTTSATAVGSGAFGLSVVGGTATSTYIVQSDAEIESGYYRIDEGQTETFTITVSVNPLAGGSFYVVLDDVDYKLVTAGVADATFDFNPQSDFDTSAVSISTGS